MVMELGSSIFVLLHTTYAYLADKRYIKLMVVMGLGLSPGPTHASCFFFCKAWSLNFGGQKSGGFEGLFTIKPFHINMHFFKGIILGLLIKKV